jgi:flagellar capping protein FliD
MGISMNGPSGIDTSYIIDSLVQMEQAKVLRVEQRRDAYQVKIDAYSSLRSHISTLSSKASALVKPEGFNLFTTATSDESLATFKAGVGSTEGSYNLRVYQLAQAEKMISTDGMITSQTAALSTLGVTPGEISIDGASVTIDADDTIQDLRYKINSATDSDGNKLNVSATVLKASDTNFRLVLTARDTGAQGAAYQDVTGSVLQDLGIITDAAGGKGITTQALQSTSSVQASFDGLAVGDSIALSGFDREGNEKSMLFVKGSASTVDDMLAEIETTFNGMVNASIEADGTLRVVDKVAGPSQMRISSMTVGGVDQGVSIAEAGSKGAGVLSVGTDAYYSIDGIMMESTANTVDGVISGVTIDMHKADSQTDVKLEMNRDYDAIVDKVAEMFDAFNEIVSFAREKTRWSDPEDEETTKGALAGDMTVRTIVSQFRGIIQNRISAFDTPYESLSMLGVKTDTQTGEMKLDKDAFRTALETDFDEVIKVFNTVGYAEDSGVVMGRYTETTETGRYTMEEVDADHLRIQREGETDWYVSDVRRGDVVSFSSGPAAGLSVAAPSGSLGAGTSFVFSKGFAEQIQALADDLSDGGEGLVHLRQESWRRSIDRIDDRIDRMERSIETYRLRLVNEFSAMEQTLSELNSQSGNMLSTLGTM